MNIYIDDDSVHGLLVKLLRKAGHDVVIPADIGFEGRDDPEHFAQAIAGDRALLTSNADDFKQLHELVLVSGGHHPGVLLVHKDNDPKRDMQPKAIVAALSNFVAQGVPVSDTVHVLNQYR